MTQGRKFSFCDDVSLLPVWLNLPLPHSPSAICASLDFPADAPASRGWPGTRGPITARNPAQQQKSDTFRL